jgi:peroxiredoxin
MNATTYNTITATLAIGVLIAFCVLIVSFTAMIVRWKTPKRRRHIIRLFVAIAIIPCLIATHQAFLWLVFLPSLGRQQMAEINAIRADRLAKTSIVHVGDLAPQFSLTTADGEEFSLTDATGDVVLINFFATWCGPCQLELPQIDGIWTARKNDKNFRLLVIGREETTESVRAYRDKNGFSFPIAADPDRAAYSLFAKESIPRTLVVSPEGLIVYSKSGFFEEDIDDLTAVLETQFADLP